METEAAIVRLSRVLGVETHELAYLARVGPAALQAVRVQVLDRLYQGEDDLLGRLAAASKLVPNGLTAKIAPKSVPPMLAAALVGLVDPDRGVRLASKLPADYLAEAALLMDPRKAAGVIPHASLDVMLPVGQILVDREEYVAMGTLVPLFSDEVLQGALPIIEDVGLLRLAFAVEDKPKLDHLVSLVSDRLEGIMRAADEHGLWAEALEVTSHIGEGNRAQLATVANRQGDEVLERMMQTVRDRGLGAQLLRLASSASEPARRRLVGLAGAQSPALVDAIVEAAIRQDLWRELLRVAAVAPSSTINRAAARIAGLDDQSLDRLIAAAHDEQQVQTLIHVANELPSAARKRLTSRPGFADPEVAYDLVRAAVRNDAWSEVLPLVGELSDDARAQVVTRVGELDDSVLTDAVVSANSGGRLPEFLDLARGMPARARATILGVVSDPSTAFGQLAPMLSNATSPDTWSKLVTASVGLPRNAVDSLSERARALGRVDIQGSLAALADPDRAGDFAAAATERAFGAQAAVATALGSIPGGKAVTNAAADVQNRLNYAAVKAAERVSGQDLSPLYTPESQWTRPEYTLAEAVAGAGGPEAPTEVPAGATTEPEPPPRRRPRPGGKKY